MLNHDQRESLERYGVEIGAGILLDQWATNGKAIGQPDELDALNRAGHQVKYGAALLAERCDPDSPNQWTRRYWTRYFQQGLASGKQGVAMTADRWRNFAENAARFADSCGRHFTGGGLLRGLPGTGEPDGLEMKYE